MRISGGDARGIKLKVPKGIRPASERVRQAIFSSLGHHVLDARVLDLYAGSGAYGLDALSRGASHATFVDTDVEACRANVVAAGFSADATVRRSDAVKYLARSGDGPFDLVFVDPPYATKEGTGPDRGVLDALDAHLDQDGRVIWESRWRDEAPDVGDGWVVEADRRYGDTRVTTLTKTRGTAG